MSQQVSKVPKLYALGTNFLIMLFQIALPLFLNQFQQTFFFGVLQKRICFCLILLLFWQQAGCREIRVKLFTYFSNLEVLNAIQIIYWCLGESVEYKNEQANQEHKIQECLQILPLPHLLEPLCHQILLILPQILLQGLIISCLCPRLRPTRPQRIEPIHLNRLLAALIIPQITQLTAPSPRSLARPSSTLASRLATTLPAAINPIPVLPLRPKPRPRRRTPSSTHAAAASRQRLQVAALLKVAIQLRVMK